MADQPTSINAMGDALQNQQAITGMFQQGFQGPLAVKQMAVQQAFEQHQLVLQHQLAMQSLASQQAFAGSEANKERAAVLNRTQMELAQRVKETSQQLEIAKMQQEGENKREGQRLDTEKALQQSRSDETYASQIRNDPIAQRLIPDALKTNTANTPESNSKLIAAYNQVATPENKEALAVSTIKNTQSQIGDTNGQIASELGSPSTQAFKVRKLLSDPTIINFLTDGHYGQRWSQTDIDNALKEGKLAPVEAALDQATDRAFHVLKDPAKVAQVAQIIQGVNNSVLDPTQTTAQMASLLNSRSGLQQRVQAFSPLIQSGEGWQSAFGSGTPLADSLKAAAAKIAPSAGAGLAPTAPTQQPATIGNANPFGVAPIPATSDPQINNWLTQAHASVVQQAGMQQHQQQVLGFANALKSIQQINAHLTTLQSAPPSPQSLQLVPQLAQAKQVASQQMQQMAQGLSPQDQALAMQSVKMQDGTASWTGNQMSPGMQNLSMQAYAPQQAAAPSSAPASSLMYGF